MYLPIYAAVFALFLIGLSVRVILLRRKLKIPVGHGDSEELHRAIRTQGNFAEYVPLTLLLIFMLEYQGGVSLFINGLCLTFLVGRIVHALGVRNVDEDYRFRVFGMSMTFLVLVVSAIGLLYLNGRGLLK